MKNGFTMNKTGFFLLALFFFFGILANIYINTDQLLSGVSDKIIRLHVIANSDSPEDQHLKLQVRDRIISGMSGRLEGLKDTEEAKNILETSLEEIEAIAEKTIEDSGFSYDVKADFARAEFPTRSYGSLTLPAGSYQSLNVVIGEGRGRNWWCVMFPPLCFIDVAHGAVSEKASKELETLLTDEEYRLLLPSKRPEKVSVKLRFKIYELARAVNLRLARTGKR